MRDDRPGGFVAAPRLVHGRACCLDGEHLEGGPPEIAPEHAEPVHHRHHEAVVATLDEAQHLAVAAFRFTGVLRIDEGGRDLVAVLLAEGEEPLRLLAERAFGAVDVGALHEVPDGLHRR